MNAANKDLLPAFRMSAQGFGPLPIHYPRLSSQVPGAGEHFEGFVANERTSRTSPGQKSAPPDLTVAADPSLPNDPTRPN